MTVQLASRISALLLAGTIIAASWTPVPQSAIANPPVVAPR